MRKFPAIALLLPVFLFLIFGWHRNSVSATTNNDPGTSPSVFEWHSAAPSLVDLNHALLERTAENIGQMEGVYSVIVVRNNHLVLERYFREGYRTKPHNLKSVTKSVMAALTGIAIEKGLLRLDQPIGDFLPQTKVLDDRRKSDITVLHLLTMTSGLEQTSYQNYQSLATNTTDWVQALLNRPLVAAPGTEHQYSTGDTHLLSAVLTKATGMSTRAFAEKYLFGPLDISVKGWDIDPRGINQGGNNLSLIPLDMARFGQLYLDGGLYRNQQIIPKWWIDASIRPNYLGKHELYGYYGYLWYSRPRGHNAFVAVGYGGQYIYISREHNAVVVITSTLKSKGDIWEKQLFDYIQHDLLGSFHGEPLLKAKQEEEAPSALNQRKALTKTRLNLRKGPGLSNTVIKVLDAGTALTIQEQINVWLNVQAQDLNGWVHADYVRFIRPEHIPAATRPGDLTTSQQERIGTKPASPQKITTAPDASLLVTEQESRLETSESTIPALEDDLSRTREKLAAEQKSVARLEAGRKRLEKALSEEQALRRAVEKQLQATEASGKNARMEAARLKEELEKQRQAIAGREAQSNKLETELAGLRDRLKSQTDALTTLQSDRDKLQVGLDAAQKASADAEQAASLALAEKKKLQNELTENRTQLSELQRSHDSLLDRLAETENQLLTELEAERDMRASVEKQLQTVEQSRYAASGELAEIQRRLDSQTGALEAIQSEKDALQAKLTALEKQYAALENTASQADAKNSALETELATARSRIEELGQIQRQITTQAEKTRQALQQELAEEQALRETMETKLQASEAKDNNNIMEAARLKEELEKQRQVLAGREAQSNKLETELAGLRDRLKSQTDALTTLQSDRDKLQVGLDAAQKASADAEQAASLALAEKKKLQNELTENRTQLSELQRSHDSLLDRLAETENQLLTELEAERDMRASVEKQLQTVEQSRYAASGKLAEIQRRLDSQTGALEAIQSEKEALQAQHTALEKQYAALENTASLADAKNSGLETELATARSRIEELGQIQRQITTQAEKTRQALQQELAEEQALRETMETKLQASEAKDKNNSMEAARLKEELEKQRQVLAGREAQSNKLETELAGLRDRLKSQTDALTTLQSDRDKLQVGLDAAQKASADAEQAASLALAEKKKLQNELTENRTQLSEFQRSHDSLLDRLAETEKQLLTELEAERARRASVEKQLQTVEQSRHAASGELAQIQRRLDSQTGALEAIQSEKEALQAKLTAMEKQYAALELASASKGAAEGTNPSIPAVGKNVLVSAQGITIDKAAEQKPDFNSIISFLNSWAGAWRQKNVDAYLARYSNNFKPSGDISLATWKKQRHQRLRKPAFIKIDISDIQYIAKGTHQASVIFTQKYQSNTYSDKVKKKLELQWENGGWTIIKETVVKQGPLKS